VFFTALALDLAATAFQNGRNRFWAGCGAACGAAMLLHPDGALLMMAIGAFEGIRVFRQWHAPNRFRQIQAAFLLVAIAVLPLVPWAVRNWYVFQRFQPLAPRYANEENEFVPMGFNRWVKTWIADYVSVEEIYWPIPGSEVDAKNLPSRGLDSRRQQTETTRLIDEYNKLLYISPGLDKRFEMLAEERIRAHPVRYYVWLPALRIAHMWLRPRTEMLPSDSRWWEFNDEPKWSALAIALGVIGVLYVGSALLGFIRTRQVAFGGLLLLFVVVRSLFLGTLENPEPRYTLEMYPVVIVFAAAALVRRAKQAAIADSSPVANQSF